MGRDGVPCKGGDGATRSGQGWERGTMATAANPWDGHGCQRRPRQGRESSVSGEERTHATVPAHTNHGRGRASESAGRAGANV